MTEAADCDGANAGAVKEFVNTPLTNITVSVDSQVDGGTFSSIECDVTGRRTPTPCRTSSLDRRAR